MRNGRLRNATGCPTCSSEPHEKYQLVERSHAKKNRPTNPLLALAERVTATGVLRWSANLTSVWLVFRRQKTPLKSGYRQAENRGFLVQDLAR